MFFSKNSQSFITSFSAIIPYVKKKHLLCSDISICNNMKTKVILSSCLLAAILTGCGNKKVIDNDVIERNEFYTVTGDSVIQGDFIAYAPSDTEVITNYSSPADEAPSPVIEFRLSLNSRDNELIPGETHYAIVGGNDTIIPLGVPAAEKPSLPADAKPLEKDAEWTLKVNVAPLVNSFKEKGLYVTNTNDTIYADDFKGIWVAGNIDPLTWDFDNLYGKDMQKLAPIEGDTIYGLKIALNPDVQKTDLPKNWKIDAPNPDYPIYTSDQTLINALYNMAIENMLAVVNADNAFRAGENWEGVWTRDASYAIHLGIGLIDPERSMNSLKIKVKNDRIIQDTGTGGSWPASSDREVWSIAAWEIYKITGDKEWLEYAYNVIKNSVADDIPTIWDSKFRLMHGEQSYLDWREQSYPKWMTPKDIYESMCLGTNAVFAETYSILAEMSEELGVDGSRYEEIAEELKNAINQNLWMENKGYYSGYIYGGVYPLKSPMTDALGQSLCVIFDIADDGRDETLIANTPATPFGISSIYPKIRNIKPYHNDAVWPFVQGYWNWAAAKAGNEDALRHGLGAIYRAAALFGTHKELFVSTTGDYRGAATNSDKQLWSAAGNLAMIYRVFAGMRYLSNGIKFEPFIPACIPGTKNLKGFKYRNAVLNVTINGTGNEIESFELDGEKRTDCFVPASIEGEHNIVINMANNTIKPSKATVKEPDFMPATPWTVWNGDSATIATPEEGVAYDIYINGEKSGTAKNGKFTVGKVDRYTTVNVVPVGKDFTGFMSRTQEFIPEGAMSVYQFEDVAPAGTDLVPANRSKNFIETTTTKNTDITFAVNVAKAGTYLIDVRYANGSGPINTDNKCAIRTLLVNNHEAGAIVMPQRGMGEWLSTGFSNMLQVELLRGKNMIQIKYITPQNVNMNGETNTALLDYMRVIKK